MNAQDIQAEGLEKTLILIDLYRDLAEHCRKVARTMPDSGTKHLFNEVADLYRSAIQLTTERIDRGDAINDISEALLIFETLRNPFSLGLCKG